MNAPLPSPLDAAIAVHVPVRAEAKAPRWRRILREPLTHFVLIGLAIFAVQQVLQYRSQRYAIAIGPETVSRVATTYAQEYGTPPDAAQLGTLLDQYLREEIYLREGMALGLDRGDEIVRRRIAQKFAFVLQDHAVPREPAEAQLRGWYAAHRQDYATPAQRSFDHVYYAIDKRGEESARALASQAAAALTQGGVPPAADAFPGTKVIRLLSQGDTDRLFGGADFAAKVFGEPKGHWVGPFRSGFGWHVVRVTEAEPVRLRRFEDVRDAVLRDWRTADREAQNRAAYDALRARYSVTGLPDTNDAPPQGNLDFEPGHWDLGE